MFSTKNRFPFFKDGEIRDCLYSYLGGISRAMGCHHVLAGGVDDHVHILSYQSRSISTAEWVKELKRASSIWIKTKGVEFDEFQWQRGYGAFSVSQSLCADVKRYIENQKIHHQKMSFQDEYRIMLKRNGIEWDEKYVWD